MQLLTKEELRHQLVTERNINKQLRHDLKQAKKDQLILTTALSNIVSWDLDLEFRVAYGSNGQRDFFRNVAECALIEISKP